MFQTKNIFFAVVILALFIGSADAGIVTGQSGSPVATVTADHAGDSKAWRGNQVAGQLSGLINFNTGKFSLMPFVGKEDSGTIPPGAIPVVVYGDFSGVGTTINVDSLNLMIIGIAQESTSIEIRNLLRQAGASDSTTTAVFQFGGATETSILTLLALVADSNHPMSIIQYGSATETTLAVLVAHAADSNHPVSVLQYGQATETTLARVAGYLSESTTIFYVNQFGAATETTALSIDSTLGGVLRKLSDTLNVTGSVTVSNPTPPTDSPLTLGIDDATALRIGQAIAASCTLTLMSGGTDSPLTIVLDDVVMNRLAELIALRDTSGGINTIDSASTISLNDASIIRLARVIALFDTGGGLSSIDSGSTISLNDATMRRLAELVALYDSQTARADSPAQGVYVINPTSPTDPLSGFATETELNRINLSLESVKRREDLVGPYQDSALAVAAWNQQNSVWTYLPVYTGGAQGDAAPGYAVRGYDQFNGDHPSMELWSMTRALNEIGDPSVILPLLVRPVSGKGDSLAVYDYAPTGSMSSDSTYIKQGSDDTLAVRFDDSPGIKVRFADTPFFALANGYDTGVNITSGSGGLGTASDRPLWVASMNTACTATLSGTTAVNGRVVISPDTALAVVFAGTQPVSGKVQAVFLNEIDTTVEVVYGPSDTILVLDADGDGDTFGAAIAELIVTTDTACLFTIGREVTATYGMKATTNPTEIRRTVAAGLAVNCIGGEPGSKLYVWGRLR